MFQIILSGRYKSESIVREELKREFQSLYSRETIDFPLTDACCPHCGKKGVLRHHGFYSRFLIVCGICIIISVHRLRCSECGHTHALMPSFIIPYEKKFCIDLLALISNKHPDFRYRYFEMTDNDIKDIRAKYSSLYDRFASADVMTDVSSTVETFIRVSGKSINTLLSSCLKNRTGFRLLRFPSCFQHNSCINVSFSPLFLRQRKGEMTYDYNQ